MTFTTVWLSEARQIRTTIKCVFEVLGHGVDPQTLADVLGITPTETWRIADTPRRSRRPYKHDGWSLRSENITSVGVEEVIRPVLEQLLPVAEILVEFCQRSRLEIFLACEVVVRDQQMAAISLSAETVEQIARVGAAFDVDVLDAGWRAAHRHAAAPRLQMHYRRVSRKR